MKNDGQNTIIIKKRQRNLNIMPFIDEKRKRSVTNKNYRYKLGEEKTSNTYKGKLNHILIKNDSMILYKNNIKQFQTNNNKDNASSILISSSVDGNERTSDSVSMFSNLRSKSNVPTSRTERTNTTFNKYAIISKIKLRKNKGKKVTFKKQFIIYVDIENYKKYNLENCYVNGSDKAQANCACIIY